MLARMRPALVAFSLLLAACANTPAHSGDAPKAAAGEVDYTCRVDSDCAVKDVGNCCGRQPACVNRESPVFPDRVKAECVKKGEMGICGFREITACRCIEARCASGDEDAGRSVIR